MRRSNASLIQPLPLIRQQMMLKREAVMNSRVVGSAGTHSQFQKIPFFSTCKCSGSVGYIHFDCLRNWLDIKKQSKLSPCFSSYYWKSFECEICKKAYPLSLRTRSSTSESGYRTYNLVDYERPDGDYLVLESLN